MSAPTFKCPLCCEGQFASFDTLKNHILGVAKNMLCPACDVRFVNILELAEHVGRRCKEKDEFDVPPLVPIGATAFSIETMKNAVASQKPRGTQTTSKGDMGQGVDGSSNPEGDQEEGSDSNMEAECTYMCEGCNVQFTSVEDHLEKYHDGEDVILETEEADPDDHVPPEDGDADGDDAHFEIADHSVGSPADLDMDVPDALTDDDVEINAEHRRRGGGGVPNVDAGRNHAVDVPITEYYIMDHGHTVKISEEDASRVEDRGAVIEIHQCPRCYLQFPKMDHYLKHICNPDKTNDNFKCAHCSAVFHTYQSLNAHMRMHIPKGADAKEKRIVTLGPHQCDVCDTMFPSFKSMKLHQRMHDPKAIAAKCRGAETAATVSSSSGVVRQMFVCNICTMTYDKQYEEIHMRYHNIEETFNCPTCNRKFDTKESLEMHSRVHNNVKKFACSHCKKTFATNDALQDHVADDCRDRVYPCRFCGRRFSRPHERVKHERIHTGERPYACQICGKAFRVSYCLTLHLRTHSGERPHACPHCGKRFKAHSVFHHHMRTHSDLRPYRCPYCPKAFKTTVQLAGHRNSHTKPFNCKECNRPFASLYAVKAHMDTHKRENNLKFDCFVCGAIYARDFALRDHVRTHHPEQADALMSGVVADVVEIDSAETVESAARLEQEMGVEDEEAAAAHQQQQGAADVGEA